MDPKSVFAGQFGGKEGILPGRCAQFIAHGMAIAICNCKFRQAISSTHLQVRSVFGSKPITQCIYIYITKMTNN